MVGGIGVSGGHYSEDSDVAEAALRGGGLSRAPNERRRNGEEAEAVIHERAE